MKVKDIISVIEEFAPLSVQESWDNSGLLVGEIRRKRQELFESLSLYYKVFILKEDFTELLEE